MGLFNRFKEFPLNQVTITPSDANDLTRPMIIYVQADGDVEIRGNNGVDITYTCVAGDILPILATRVLEGTTATVVGLY